MKQLSCRLGAGAGVGWAALACAGAAMAQTSPAATAAAPSLGEAIVGGRLLLEARARYEYVDQANLAASAEAATLRTRLGWETGDWHGVRGLAEFEDIRLLGPERFAVNVPGATTPPLNGADKAKYPLVNDPQMTELNRLQLAWRVSPSLAVTVGRQRILIDDQRFVGNVGWRQDEQTFDAARLDASYGRVRLVYAYVTRVNRTLGELRDWRSDSHLVNAAWSLAEPLRLEGFLYALDFSNSAANASLTGGVKASGKTRLGPYQLAYNATWARQSDYRHNTPAYDLDYWGGDVAATYDIYTVKASYEQLEGNGVRGFTTPLATTHAFQGWADAWVQPLGGAKGFVDGLKDFNVTLNLKPGFKAAYWSKTDIIVRYHNFDDERTGAHLAHEWDAQVQAAITPRLTAALKYADFERVDHTPLGSAAPPASRSKVWVFFEYKL